MCCERINPWPTIRCLDIELFFWLSEAVMAPLVTLLTGLFTLTILGTARHHEGHGEKMYYRHQPSTISTFLGNIYPVTRPNLKHKFIDCVSLAFNSPWPSWWPGVQGAWRASGPMWPAWAARRSWSASSPARWQTTQELTSEQIDVFLQYCQAQLSQSPKEVKMNSGVKTDPTRHSLELEC